MNTFSHNCPAANSLLIQFTLFPVKITTNLELKHFLKEKEIDLLGSGCSPIESCRDMTICAELEGWI